MSHRAQAAYREDEKRRMMREDVRKHPNLRLPAWVGSLAGRDERHKFVSNFKRTKDVYIPNLYGIPNQCLHCFGWYDDWRHWGGPDGSVLPPTRKSIGGSTYRRIKRAREAAAVAARYQARVAARRNGLGA